jgi:DNA-binding LacI/PurR family transcriptional regulator
MGATPTAAGPGMRKGKATSFDIAYLAGVSQPTVSRALRGSPTVNEQTRQRILQIAAELNYKVDKNASNLRNQQSGTLALLFFEDPTLDDSLINPFFLSMLGSLTRACALQGYDLLISFQQLSSNWHMEYEDSKKADGLILLGYGDYVEYLHRLALLVDQGTHFVRWGVVLPGQPGVSIGCDNHQGGRDMTRHLLERGRRHIAFVGHASEHYPEFFERYKGYSQSLQQAGIASFTNPSLTTVQQDTKAAATLLVESLLALIHDEPVESKTIPAKLAIRQSTASC